MSLFSKKFHFGILLLLISGSMGLHCQESEPDVAPPPPSVGTVNVNWYLTRGDGSALLAKQTTAPSKSTDANLPTITLNASKTYQEMDGFGFTLTGGSASHLYNMSAARRNAILTELFDIDDENVGFSYLRLSIGASDLDAEIFSYNDLPAGQTDVDMNNFSLAPDRKYLIPMLKEILSINPNIKIMGSPWSAPVWMKTNGATKGGSLKPMYYAAYAKYFVKYVQEMAKEGIVIDAITVQNEPLHAGNNPSLYMEPEEQIAFVKTALGPAFEAASIKTKIIVYDHNADRTDYPITVLNDQDARKYIDGSAFHLYGGVINNVSAVHTAHPDKNLYFTEQWTGAPGNLPVDLRDGIRDLTIGAPRNWCKTVLQWNLSSNPTLTPHTSSGGCTSCLGAITIDGDVVTRNPAYYVIGHASKFVRPGSLRIDSNYINDLPNVAYKTKDGKIVVIVLNNTNESKSFNLSNGTESFTSTLAGGAVATYVW